MKYRPRFRFATALTCAIVFALHSAGAAPVGIGIQFGQWGLPDYPYNTVPGYQTAMSGTLSDGRSYATTLSGGTTSAFAGFGALTLSVQHTSLDASLSTAYTYAYAYFADTVTVNAPGLAGQSGSLTYSFILDGPLVANGATTDQEVYVDYGWGSDAGDGVIPSMNSYADYNGMRSLSGWNYGDWGLFVGVEQTRTINFTYGQPFDFWLNIRARTDIITSEPGSVSATLSLTEWSGFEDFKVGGTPVANATLSSTSGTDWTQPIPEPSSAVLLVASLALVASFRRRQ